MMSTDECHRIVREAMKEGKISLKPVEQIDWDLIRRRRKAKLCMRRLRAGKPTKYRMTKRMRVAAESKPVYVDPLFTLPSRNPHAFRVGRKHRHQWCHMWSEDVDALHIMASRIGLRRAWFQNKSGFPHYDLVPPYRKKAIGFGAIERTLQSWLMETKHGIKPEPAPVVEQVELI